MCFEKPNPLSQFVVSNRELLHPKMVSVGYLWNKFSARNRKYNKLMGKKKIPTLRF